METNSVDECELLEIRLREINRVIDELERIRVAIKSPKLRLRPELLLAAQIGEMDWLEELHRLLYD